MFESIRSYKKHKGIIPPLQISNLKHINVLVGKNNSGKTSILENISSNSENNPAIIIGYSLENYDFRKMFRYIMLEELKKIYGDDENIENGFKEFIDRTNQFHNFLYINDIAKISDNMHNYFSACFNINPHPRLKFPEILNKILTDKRLIKPNPVLLPSDRKTKATAPFSIGEQLHEKGNNLVEFLFEIQNNENGTDLRNKYDLIAKHFKCITGCDFFVAMDKKLFGDTGHESLLLKFRENKEFYPADSCGFGLQQVLLIITYAICADYNLIMIEEPENNLHPEMQKKLLSFLKTINDKQFLISTHSNTVIDLNFVDQIYYVWYDGKVNIEEKTNRYELLSSIGYTTIDNLTSDIIVLTEGPHDIPVIQHMLSWFGVEQKAKIGYSFLGGTNMQFVDLDVYKANNDVFVLIDNEPLNKFNQDILMQNCRDANIYCHQLEGYAIENYFNIDKFNEVNNTNYKEIVFKEKIPKNKSGFCKKKNIEVVKLMKKEDFENTDLYTGFIAKIVEYVNEKFS